MTSEVFICSLALSNIGKETINALTETSAEARACRLFYEQTRDMLFQVYPWRFAGKSLSMGEVANDKLGTWLYAYQRPTDCLKVRQIRPNYTLTPDAPAAGEYGYLHEIEGQTIYCDLSPAVIQYTARITDVAKYPPAFVDALAWHLSVRLAMPLTRDAKMRADAYNLAVRMQGIAEMADSSEQISEYNHTSEYIRVRE